jgi:NAD(P)-dependent dehydrogenase (short-subunit alcohol dehydrogenase family)
MAGAASGIGAATAHRLALEGATVVLGRDGGWSIVKESA